MSRRPQVPQSQERSSSKWALQVARLTSPGPEMIIHLMFGLRRLAVPLLAIVLAWHGLLVTAPHVHATGAGDEHETLQPEHRIEPEQGCLVCAVTRAMAAPEPGLPELRLGPAKAGSPPLRSTVPTRTMAVDHDSRGPPAADHRCVDSA